MQYTDELIANWPWSKMSLKSIGRLRLWMRQFGAKITNSGDPNPTPFLAVGLRKKSYEKIFKIPYHLLFMDIDDLKFTITSCCPKKDKKQIFTCFF